MFIPKHAFKAAVLVNANSPIQIVEVVPPALKEGEALVKVEYSGVCRSQVMEYRGMRGIDPWLPHLLGHEGIGYVVDVYSDSDLHWIGKKVIISWLRGRSEVTTNRKYLSVKGSEINAGDVTTLAQYSVVPIQRIHRVESNMELKELCLLGCSLTTGAHMAFTHAKPEYVKSCLVIGFGGVGSAAAIIARAVLGFEPVIIEESPERRSLAQRLGFSRVISSSQAKMSSEYFDLCMEAGGSVETIELGFKMITRNGTLVFASHPESGKVVSLDPFELIQGKKIFGSWGAEDKSGVTISRLIELCESNFVDLSLLVGEVFSLEEINQALEYASSNKPGRAMVKMW